MSPQVRILASAVKQVDKAPAAQREKLRWWLHRLETDLTVGTRVPARRVPRVFHPHLVDATLWRVPLIDGWRAIYTIQRDGQTTLILVLWLGPHKEYDRLMGYSKG